MSPGLEGAEILLGDRVDRDESSSETTAIVVLPSASLSFSGGFSGGPSPPEGGPGLSSIRSIDSFF